MPGTAQPEVTAGTLRQRPSQQQEGGTDHSEHHTRRKRTRRGLQPLGSGVLLLSNTANSVRCCMKFTTRKFTFQKKQTCQSIPLSKTFLNKHNTIKLTKIHRGCASTGGVLSAVGVKDTCPDPEHAALDCDTKHVLSGGSLIWKQMLTAQMLLQGEL